MIWTDETLRVIDDSSDYAAPNGTVYPAGFPKSEIPGLVPVNMTQPPEGLVVDGFYVDETATQVWRSHEETDGEARARIRKQVAVLEASITDRMWREDALGSTTVIVIRDADGKEDTADPRNGKTPTEYIAWVDGEIRRLWGALS